MRLHTKKFNQKIGNIRIRGQNLISIEEKLLLEIFIALFEFDSEPSPAILQQTAYKNWDSMMIANLVMAVENEFQVSISNDEYEEFTSFSQIMAILNEKKI